MELLAPLEIGIRLEDGSTALTKAAYKGRHECIPFLLGEAKL